MIIMGKYDEFGPNMGLPSIREFIQDKPYEGQEKIVEYLRNGRVHMVTATRFIDVFTGERVNSELVYMDDGVYTWSSKLPYYVEKYNLRLPLEFEKHILGN
jgi:hypothetical protein